MRGRTLLSMHVYEVRSAELEEFCLRGWVSDRSKKQWSLEKALGKDADSLASGVVTPKHPLSDRSPLSSHTAGELLGSFVQVGFVWLFFVEILFPHNKQPTPLESTTLQVCFKFLL
jgi:hypothetical protein